MADEQQQTGVTRIEFYNWLIGVFTALVFVHTFATFGRTESWLDKVFWFAVMAILLGNLIRLSVLYRRECNRRSSQNDKIA